MILRLLAALALACGSSPPPPRAHAELEAGSPTIMGSILVEAVDGAFAAAAPAIGPCAGDLDRIVVHVEIQHDGSLTDVRTEPEDEALRGCVEAALSAQDFPEPNGPPMH